ncbi:MAG: IclR family transcriptional regulator [Dehalococcoidia bacterium]|nr:IclR family transcriptional regulator [Dehalococcoidia bacterium]
MAIATSRTIDVLEALGESQDPLSLADIVAATGIGRASAGRLLSSMIEGATVVAEGDPPRYRLGLRCWSLGTGALRQRPAVGVALPYLIELARALNTRVNISLPEGMEMVFVQSVEPVGTRLTVQPIYTRTRLLETASGRIVAAFADNEALGRLSAEGLPKLTPYTRTTAEVIADLPEVRRKGYAVIDRERDLDVSGVALPIRDRTGSVVAAVGLPILGPMSTEFVSGVLSAALDVATRISVELGFPMRQSLPLA